MTNTQLILTIITGSALFIKGSQLIKAINRKSWKLVIIELLFCALILIIGLCLIFFNR